MKKKLHDTVWRVYINETVKRQFTIHERDEIECIYTLIGSSYYKRNIAAGYCTRVQ